MQSGGNSSSRVHSLNPAPTSDDASTDGERGKGVIIKEDEVLNERLKAAATSMIPVPGFVAASKLPPPENLHEQQPNPVHHHSPNVFRPVPGAPIPVPMPVLPAQQQGFIRFGTDLSPVFPRLSNSWGLQPVENPFQYHGFPYDGRCISEGPSLDKMVEDSGNYSSLQMDNLFGHIPGHYCQDSVVRAGFLPVLPMFQNPFFTSSVRGPPLNYAHFFPHSENQETNVTTTSHIPLSENSRESNALVSTQKGKMGIMSGSSSMTMDLDGNSTAKSEPSGYISTMPSLECNAPKAADNSKSTMITKSLEPHYGYRLEDEKEVEVQGLMVLVQKELRNTDVGSLGRIVIPKRDAEANLPHLDVKDGVILQMEDITDTSKWKFKYRYWPNNKSRMYLMENTGDFVRKHNLQTGDYFVVYMEENSGKYIVSGKKVTPVRARDKVGPREELTKEGEMEGNANKKKNEGNNPVPWLSGSKS